MSQPNKRDTIVGINARNQDDPMMSAAIVAAYREELLKPFDELAKEWREFGPGGEVTERAADLEWLIAKAREP